MTVAVPQRVWVDEPDLVYRRGLVSCLDRGGFEVVGESARLLPEPALAGVAVLLFDLRSGGLREAVRLVRGRTTRLVGVTQEGEPQVLLDAVEAGLGGVLMRPRLTPDALLTCLNSVAAGNVSVSAGVLGGALGQLAREADRAAGSGDLRERELEVLALLARGGDTREIASRLSYSERTVKNIVQAIMLKTNCRTRAHAVALATRQGFI